MEALKALTMNIDVVAIAMESIVVIPLIFEEEKRVSSWMFLDFVALHGFILEDGFLELEVEMGNM